MRASSDCSNCSSACVTPLSVWKSLAIWLGPGTWVLLGSSRICMVPYLSLLASEFTDTNDARF